MNDEAKRHAEETGPDDEERAAADDHLQELRRGNARLGRRTGYLAAEQEGAYRREYAAPEEPYTVFARHPYKPVDRPQKLSPNTAINFRRDHTCNEIIEAIEEACRGGGSWVTVSVFHEDLHFIGEHFTSLGFIVDILKPEDATYEQLCDAGSSKPHPRLKIAWPVEQPAEPQVIGESDKNEPSPNVMRQSKVSNDLLDDIGETGYVPGPRNR